MKTAIIRITLLILCLGLAAGCAKEQPSLWESIKNPEVVTQLKSFVAEKTAQAKADGVALPPDFKDFFDAAARGDWLAVSNSFEDFHHKRAGQFEHSGESDEWLRGAKWEAVLEIWGALDAFGEGDEKYSALYAKDIIESIPAGSIYFGGTEPGQLLITAMQKNQAAGDPFFTVAQNGLVNASYRATYLDYLHAMYGGKIYTPTEEDLQRSFRDYTTNAQRRLAHDKQFPNEPRQLMPGEEVKLDSNGQIQLTTQMNVIGIRELLAKIIFDQNSNREFYVEESFPLDWMRPYLEPHGLIMKLNRQPLPTLSDESVQRDRHYWTKLTAPMIGGWLKPETSVQEATAFAEKVFAKHDFSGFTGDPQFVRNDYSCKMFSKERSSIAGLYAWRAQHATSAAEKQRMNNAADFAFRQAWVLCPYSLETVFQYGSFLVSQNRRADALLVAETAAKMPEMKGNGSLRAFVTELGNSNIKVK